MPHDVATTVIGATTIEELRSDLGALSVQLDAGRERRLPLIKLTGMRSSVSQRSEPDVFQDKSLIRITPTRWGPIATGGFPADVAARLDALL